MNIRTLAHHAGLPVRQDRAEAEKIAEWAADRAGESGDFRTRLVAAWTDVLTEQAHWHRPYLRPVRR